MTNYGRQATICVHDYPTYIDAHGVIRCDNCDRVVGYNY